MKLNPFWHSIRWRLSLSHGGIAFFSAVTLGGILLLSLRSYYVRVEQQYLEQNGLAVSAGLEQLLGVPDAAPLLQSQIEMYAYLTQTRIRLLDEQGREVAATGRPQDLQAVATLSLAVETDDARQEVSQTVENQDGNPALTSLVVVEVEGGRYMAESSVSGNITGAGTVEGLSGTFMQVDTPFSYGAVGDRDWRSKQIYTMELLPAGAAKPMVLELSQGPAFGEAVLLSVRRGVWLAGALAVVLATAVGAMSSRRFSRPIARLAGVTAAMTAGDLTARAPVRGEDEIGQLSRSFNEMAARIEQTVETLRKFIADAAHELNTPLTALRTNLELVLVKSSTTKDSPLHAAHEQALRLQRLNDDLLRLSHLESGLAQEQYSLVDLGDLVAAHSERFAAEAEQKGVAFTVVLPRESVRLWGQRQNLGRLVENLLDNALKFTAEGAITVQVEAEGEWAKLSIADTGMGLIVETGQLFGRFYRGENALAFPGSGLGLAIVQTIATTHRGRVTATARAQGSEFCVCLPLNSG